MTVDTIGPIIEPIVIEPSESSMRTSRFVCAGIVAASLVVGGGCSSSDSSDPAAHSKSTSAGDESPAQQTGEKAEGTLTLVVDGTTVDTGTPNDCNINDFEGDPIFAFTASKGNSDTGLSVRLPPEPGTIGERDGGVILPEPADGDSFQPTREVSGSWKRTGDTATGHLEGTAKHVSAITAQDAPPPSTFTIDFSCTVTEVNLDDVGN